VKRAITKVIFNKLHVDAEDIAGHDLKDGIKGLVEAGAPAGRTAFTSTDDESSSTLDEDGAAFDLATDAALLGVVREDHGSNRTAMVGDTGIEPVTPTVSTKINKLSDLRKRDSGTSNGSIGSRWTRFSAVERNYRLPICSHALLPQLR
jgi:hypothetical protein